MIDLEGGIERINCGLNAFASIRAFSNMTDAVTQAPNLILLKKLSSQTSEKQSSASYPMSNKRKFTIEGAKNSWKKVQCFCTLFWLLEFLSFLMCNNNVYENKYNKV